MISIQGKVRCSGIDCGQTRWKEGEISLLEDKGVIYCFMSPKVGYQKKFKLSNNIKGISEAKENRRKIIIALSDGNHIHLDHAKQPDRVGQLSRYLHELKAIPGIKGRNVRNLPGIPNASKVTSPENKESINSRHSPRCLSSPRGSLTPKKNTSGYTLSNTTPYRERLSSSQGKANVIKNDEQENLDKENEGIMRTITPRSDRKGLFERKMGSSGSQFLSAFDDKQKAYEERKTSSPVIGTGFYSRGQRMVNYGLNNSFMSSRTHSTSPVKRQPGFLSDPTHLIKKPRLGESYEGWRYKNNLTLSNNSQVSLQGFSNLGNTCYMNAILQSLFGLETFAADILNYELIKKVPKYSLYKCLTHLLHVKRAGRFMQVEQKRDLLKKVKNAISSSAERFSGFLQHDAHEFLNQCLDQLQDDVEKINKGLRANSPKTGNRVNIAEREVEDREDIVVDTFTCPVTLNFEFEVLHVITCNNCGEVVTKSERFYDLSLDMPRRKDSSIAKSIQDAIDQFFKDEKIEYECNECHSKESTVTHKFTKLPRILVLHLKRYSYNITTLKNTKLGESIDIPKYLTLSLHCTEETVPPFLAERKPNIMSPSKQDKCWGIHDDQDNKNQTARKRLYGEHTGFETSRQKFKFKRTKKVHESDSENEDECRKGSEITSVNSQKQDKDIESDFKPLDDLTEEQQIAKAIEMSEQDTKDKNNRELSFEEFSGMTEEQQLAKAMELSRRESSGESGLEECIRRESSGDGGVEELSRRESSGEGGVEECTRRDSSGEVGVDDNKVLGNCRETKSGIDESCNGMKGIEESNVLRNCSGSEGTERTDPLNISSEVTVDNNKDVIDGGMKEHCGHNTKDIDSAENKHNTHINTDAHELKPNEMTDQANIDVTNTESAPNSADTVISSIKGRTVLSIENSQETKLDLTDMLEPKTVGSIAQGLNSQDTSPLQSNNVALTSPSPTTKVHPFFARVKQSAEKCIQNTYKSLHKVFSPSKERPISFIQGANTTEKQDKQEDIFDMGTDEPESINLPNFYNDDYDKDKEDKDLAAAISASMKDQQVLEQEDEDIKRAKELSLQDFEKTFYENSDCGLTSDGEQELDLTKEDFEALKTNEEIASLPFSYQLTSVVSHIGSLSSMGHYISDVYDAKKKTWVSYDDTEVDKIDEESVRMRRRRTGYIFFYRCKDIVDESPREQEVQHGRHSLPR